MLFLSRKTRSITSITEQGIPIIEESYADHRRNRTKLIKGIDTKREKNPSLKLTWNGQTHSRHINSHRRWNIL